MVATDGTDSTDGEGLGSVQFSVRAEGRGMRLSMM
jgi:hypothetical protein